MSNVNINSEVFVAVGVTIGLGIAGGTILGYIGIVFIDLIMEGVSK